MLWEIVGCEKGKEFCGGSVVKNLPAMQETQEMWVQPLGQEDPWRRKWQPTPVFLSREFYGQRSAGGYSPWSHKESDTTEHAHTERKIDVKDLKQYWTWPIGKIRLKNGTQELENVVEGKRDEGLILPSRKKALGLNWKLRV